LALSCLPAPPPQSQRFARGEVQQRGGVGPAPPQAATGADRASATRTRVTSLRGVALEREIPLFPKFGLQQKAF
jgi:hypothetical protein